ncbi:MAG: WbuC family cupin fold metalloprotein [Oscillospiraceae bacterium]|nr:WbuC family cupin fold metalloprotein [Candidatus Limimonas egerieequi]
MKIDKKLFDEVANLAAKSPRLRMNYDLRNDENEQSQRMLNVLLPGTMSPIHKHTETSETVVCLEGTCIERYYDNEGRETSTFTLSAGSDLIGLQIPAGQFHSLEVPAEWSEKAVILEFKAGQFEPAKTEDILK